MDSKSAAKVGMFILLTLGVGIAFYFALAHINPNTYTVKVSFTNTKGLQKQSVVRMQGVSIGEVKEVALDTKQRPPRPVVTMAIRNNFGIPEGSTFRIVSGLLITNPQVEIVPGQEQQPIARNSDKVLVGADSGSALDALSPELSQTVTKLNATFDDLNKRFAVASDKINRILDQSQMLLATTNRAAKTGEQLISDPQLRTSLKNTVGNFERTSAQLAVTSKDLSQQLSATLKSGQTSLDTLTGNLSNILTRIDTTIDDANTVVKKLTEQVTDPRLQNTLQETADLARTTLARFNQIASDLHQITGDPQLQNNLRQTVQNLQNATEQGEQAVKRINDLIGKLTGETTGGTRPSLRLPQVQFVGNISEQIDPARLRVDAEARIGLGGRDLLSAGVYDFGGNSRLILQGGRRLNDILLARYGLYASKLGLGLEWTPNHGTGFRADLWDANRPQLDLRALFRVNKNASVWLGAEGIFRGDVSPILGIQISR
jgi:phospholipid/cholesterol/gamma-HCH transport system substrate-binding protein